MSALVADEMLSRAPVPESRPTRPVLHLVPDRACPPRVRLTRRGHLLLRLTTFVCAVALAIVVGAVVGLAARPAAVPPTVVTTVERGESLWTIAASMTPPGRDVREVVAQIVRLNGLQDDVVLVGQSLRVPASQAEPSR